MATVRVNSEDGKSSSPVNFFLVVPEEFSLPAGATLSLEEHLDHGCKRDERVEKYRTPFVIRYGTAVGSIRSGYNNHFNFWSFVIFIESKSHADLIGCYDAIRAELGGETVVVISNFPGNLCEAITAIVTAPFELVAGIFGALTGSSKQ